MARQCMASIRLFVIHPFGSGLSLCVLVIVVVLFGRYEKDACKDRETATANTTVTNSTRVDHGGEEGEEELGVVR